VASKGFRILISHVNKFVIDHEHENWLMPQPPNSLSAVELTQWLFSRDEIGWLKVDLNFDLSTWKKEMMIAEQYYVNHRWSKNYQESEHQGWQSCCIHGLGVSNTTANDSANQDFFHWTELSDQVPNIKKFWLEFPVQYFRRLRFMKLDPGGYIGVHNDVPTESPFKNLADLKPLENTVTVNVAITQPKDCKFVIENCGTVPWNEGSIFMINNTKNHCVVNNSDKPRIHVIAECVVGNRLNDFSELVYRSFKKEYGYN
jgi:hypothetical protein